MSLRSTVVYKEGDLFYRMGQKFKGHLRPTIIDSWRQFQSCWHPRYHYSCPKSPRKDFTNDYKAFKERRGNQDIYFKVLECYDHNTSVGQLQVVTPGYKIDKDRISEVYNIYRGRYPTSILVVEPIDMFPRESGEVTPGEKIIDNANIHGRDADMFVALRGFQVVKGLNTMTDQSQEISMTGAGHYMPNPYNPGYDYIEGRLVKHEKDEKRDD